MTAADFRLTEWVPPERSVHEQCAKVLDALLLPPAMWFTYPAGVIKLTKQQAAALTRIGLKRGFPDIWVLYNGVWLLELKRPGGTLSRTRIVRTRRGAPRILEGQVDVFPRLCATGAVNDIAAIYTVDDMLRQLDQWEIPLRARVPA